MLTSAKENINVNEAIEMLLKEVKFCQIYAKAKVNLECCFLKPSNLHRQIADKEIEQHGNAELSSNNQGSNLGVDDQASIKLEIDSKRKSKANCKC